MLKGYKIRIYPTPKQEQLFMTHINGCRFVWNWALAQQKQAYQDNKKCLKAFDMINQLSELKQQPEYKWLYDISNASCQIVCRDMYKAYERFFQKLSRLPKFKSKKRQKLNFPVRSDAVYFIDSKYVNIEKVGHVKYKSDIIFVNGKHKEKIYNSRIKQLNGKWFICFVREVENQDHGELNNYDMGIDVGIKNTITAIYGDNVVTFPNINHGHTLKRLKKKLRYYQRILSRKIRMNMRGHHHIETNNIKRIKAKIHSVSERLRGIRLNYLHHCSRYCTSLKPQHLGIEHLEVRRLLRRKTRRHVHHQKRYSRLNGLIWEQCFGLLLYQLAYKAQEYGTEVIIAPASYPSSQTCSHCGFVHKKLKLGDRTYTCPSCGFTIDRDLNAAINLMRYRVSI